MVTYKETATEIFLTYRENVMKEVEGSHHEIRDLIILRNKLAYYLTRKLKVYEKLEEIKEGQPIIELPEPISHPSCEKCTLKTLCCAYLTKDKDFRLSEKHPLKPIIENIFRYLSEDHINYVMEWANWLQMEETATEIDFAQSNIWTMDYAER